MIKFLLGLFLLPACVATTMVFADEILGEIAAELYFVAGLLSYLVLLAIFQQPVRTYIFGHELTHVIWVWLFGGRVKKFSAAASGGQVKASKSNFLIFLAPYFFPFYSILAVLIFLGLKLFWPLSPHPPVLGFVLGFTWAFHITFTIYVLIQGQPDVWACGRVFSFPFIYISNLVVLACLIIFSSPRLSYGRFFPHLWEGIEGAYRCVWSTAPDFCRSCFKYLSS